MDAAEDLLRRLACNDERALSMVLSRRRGSSEADLAPKVELLVQLAALLEVGAAVPVLRDATAQASAQGATVSEIVGVLVPSGRRSVSRASSPKHPDWQRRSAMTSRTGPRDEPGLR